MQQSGPRDETERLTHRLKASSVAQARLKVGTVGVAGPVTDSRCALWLRHIPELRLSRPV